MAELKAHCKQADHLSQAMVDVVDVFSRLEGGLAVQRACLAPGTLFRAQKPGAAPREESLPLQGAYAHSLTLQLKRKPLRLRDRARQQPTRSEASRRCVCA